MSRPLFKLGRQYTRVRDGWYGPIGATDATTILDKVIFDDEPDELVAHTSASGPVNPGSYPIRPNLDDVIERSRVDALERRADTRDTTFAKILGRVDALETARAWIDTQEVKARLDNHKEHLRNLQDRIVAIESALTLPILTTKPKE